MLVRRTVRTLAFRGLNDANLKISPPPHGYRYKLHDKSLPGKPDIVLPKYKTVIFVHRCFWPDIKTVNTLLFTKQELNAGIQHYHLLLLSLSTFCVPPSFIFFCTFLILSAVGRFSGIVPPISLIALRTFTPTS